MFSRSPPLAWSWTTKSPKVRNSTASNKKRSEHPNEFLEGTNRTCSQAIKPSHCYRPQTGREHLTHRGLIPRVNSHSLVEVAYMLYRIYWTIAHGEC